MVSMPRKVEPREEEPRYRLTSGLKPKFPPPLVIKTLVALYVVGAAAWTISMALSGPVDRLFGSDISLVFHFWRSKIATLLKSVLGVSGIVDSYSLAHLWSLSAVFYLIVGVGLWLGARWGWFLAFLSSAASVIFDAYQLLWAIQLGGASLEASNAVAISAIVGLIVNTVIIYFITREAVRDLYFRKPIRIKTAPYPKLRKAS